MKEIPKTIELQDGQVLKIENYSNGIFDIGHSPTLSKYNIETSQFLWYRNNRLFPAGVTAKDPEYFRKWKDEFEQFS